MPTEFKLPELGENVESGDVTKILVAPGDSIAKDQAVVELETEKATIEVPSPTAGTVKQVHVKQGQKVKVGELILTIDDGAAAPAEKKEAKPEAAKKKEEKEEPRPAEKTEAKAAAVAPEVQEAKSPAKAEVADATEVEPAKEERPAPEPAVAKAPAEVEPEAAKGAPAPAAPSVRRLARELGVEIHAVRGSGERGRISIEDVKAHVKAAMQSRAAGAPAVAAPSLPDFSKWGAVERKGMTGIRRATARHLSHAWQTIPHVTNHDKADVSNLSEMQKKLGPKVEQAGGKLTMTAIALKVIASALKVFPQFASSIDLAREEIIYKKYCHIGVAVDTDRGLLVPVIRDADHKNILELSIELGKLAEKARAGKLTLQEMQGGVFTITNLGGIGGTHFSPIINAPEVAILGISRARTEPVYVDGHFEPRSLLPLSLSYDHRMIDGADAARFLRWVVEAFEQPFLLSFEG